jgi:hypothetical protein
MSKDDGYKVVKNGLKSLFIAAKNAVTGKDQYVSEEIQKERQNICNRCPKRVAALNQCGVCKCFLSLKTTLKQESCPEGKWSKVEDK